VLHFYHAIPVIDFGLVNFSSQSFLYILEHAGPLCILKDKVELKARTGEVILYILSYSNVIVFKIIFTSQKSKH